MPHGRFITFEGGEGSGKSTQTTHLVGHLKARGVPVVATREPGGSKLAEKLRAVILEAPPRAPAAEFLLFAAARAEHIAEVIAPALEAGTWVICDRYIDSTRVYQGRVAGIPHALVEAIETHTVAPFIPDLTIVLDVHPGLGLERARTRGDLTRYDAEGTAYHEAIREGFLTVAAAEPERCVVLDADAPEGELAGKIAALVDRRFPPGMAG